MDRFERRLSHSEVAEIARRQLADYDAHRPGRYFLDAPRALAVAEAYEVQREVTALRVARGDTVAGYKIGCVSQAIQQQLGISHPVFGRLFRSELHRSGVTLDPSAYENLAIEGEFAIRIGEDGAPAEVLAVIELHNNVFHGETRTAAELIANNAMQAGVVLPSGGGSMIPDDRIEVFRNGELLGAATAGALLASLNLVAAHLASTGDSLRSGDLILTGSPLPLYPVTPGDSISVRTTKCGEVRLSVPFWN